MSATLVIETALGDIVIALHEQAAPRSCRYILELVDRGAFTPCSIFRIVTQANDVSETGNLIEAVQFGHRCADPNTPVVIPHESTHVSGLRHVRGTVSLPRYRPGAVYSSIFICPRDEPALDFGGGRNLDRQGFAAFGSVSAGWNVLDAAYALAEDRDYLTRPIPVRTVHR